MKTKYKVRYELGDKAIEISANNGIRIWVDCDDVEWDQPDPRTLAARLRDWLETQSFPTLKQAETARLRASGTPERRESSFDFWR